MADNGLNGKDRIGDGVDDGFRIQRACSAISRLRSECSRKDAIMSSIAELDDAYRAGMAPFEPSSWPWWKRFLVRIGILEYPAHRLPDDALERISGTISEYEKILERCRLEVNSVTMEIASMELRSDERALAEIMGEGIENTRLLRLLLREN